jgi:hypothetical protein
MSRVASLMELEHYLRDGSNAFFALIKAQLGPARCLPAAHAAQPPRPEYAAAHVIPYGACAMRICLTAGMSRPVVRYRSSEEG